VTEIFSRLTRWYVANCNDCWEHSYGVKLETLDNPGWLVTFDLTGTPLENMPFPPVIVGCQIDGTPVEETWRHCRIVNGRWEGAGSPSQLERLLSTFLDWAESSGK